MQTLYKHLKKDFGLIINTQIINNWVTNKWAFFDEIHIISLQFSFNIKLKWKRVDKVETQTLF